MQGLIGLNLSLNPVLKQSFLDTYNEIKSNPANAIIYRGLAEGNPYGKSGSRCAFCDEATLVRTIKLLYNDLIDSDELVAEENQVALNKSFLILEVVFFLEAHQLTTHTEKQFVAKVTAITRLRKQAASAERELQKAMENAIDLLNKRNEYVLGMETLY